MRSALTGVERALFWTLAFAAFAAAAAGLSARAVDRLAAGYEDARRNYAIVRVLAPEGPEGLAAAEAALAQAPQITSAAPMSAERAAALLGQWGGSAVTAEDMPPLRLIEIELALDPDQIDPAGDIVAALAQGGVTAEVIEAPDNSSGGGLAGRVRAAAFWGALAFAGVMAVIVANFAVRVAEQSVEPPAGAQHGGQLAGGDIDLIRRAGGGAEIEPGEPRQVPRLVDLAGEEVSFPLLVPLHRICPEAPALVGRKSGGGRDQFGPVGPIGEGLVRCLAALGAVRRAVTENAVGPGVVERARVGQDVVDLDLGREQLLDPDRLQRIGALRHAAARALLLLEQAKAQPALAVSSWP